MTGRTTETPTHPEVHLMVYLLRRLFLSNSTSSIVAIVAMGLGIGLTGSMWAVIDGVFLRGLPFPEPQRILHLERNDLAHDVQSMEVTRHDFADWRSQQQSFEGLAGFTSGTFNISDTGVPARYNGAWISANFLTLLRVQPVLGRGFTGGDEKDGAEPVILIGHHVWHSRYGGSPDVVGKVIRVNAGQATIIGVLPEGFRFPIQEDAWMPLALGLHQLERGEGGSLEVFGRLRDGTNIDQAGSEMATIAQRLATQYPKTNEGVSAVVQPFMQEFIGSETIQLLKVMFVAVLLVLLIACFNVANLLIGRASLRSRELAIRSALGSSRARVVGHVLAEASLIAGAGALLGIGLAQLGLRLLTTVMSAVDTPFWFHFTIDARVLLTIVGATIGAALISGLVPALQASRPDLALVLQDTGRGTTSFRLGLISRALVVIEVAISCALLVGAGLMVRSVLSASDYDLGFETNNLLTARLGLFEGDYPEETDWVAFFERLREEVAARPEVVRAAIGTSIPTDTEIGSDGTRFERIGETYENPRDMPFARLNTAGPGYFESLGINLLAGRDFDHTDQSESLAVAIVNNDFARKEWPGENPIGQRINLWRGEEAETEDPDAGWVEVVGLVPNLRFAEFDNDDDQQAIYLPFAQQPQRFAWIIARTQGDPMAFADSLRRTVLGLDANLPLYFVRSMDQVLTQTMFYSNLIGWLFGIFGAVAVILACLGLYGVMAFAVTQRTQEMGVRMAFGARARDVLSLVLKAGFRQVSLGLVLGLALGAGMAMALRSFLFQVEALDAVTFVATPLLLLAVALLACLLPAQRAAAVDPIIALRHE